MAVNDFPLFVMVFVTILWLHWSINMRFKSVGRCATARVTIDSAYFGKAVWSGRREGGREGAGGRL
jgi:hypothetical protein